MNMMAREAHISIIYIQLFNMVVLQKMSKLSYPSHPRMTFLSGNLSKILLVFKFGKELKYF